MRRSRSRRLPLPPAKLTLTAWIGNFGFHEVRIIDFSPSEYLVLMREDCSVGWIKECARMQRLVRIQPAMRMRRDHYLR